MVNETSKKIILTDVDGVLLNWVDPFKEWMDHKGYEEHQHIDDVRVNYDIRHQYSNVCNVREKELIGEFNLSKLFSSLSPMRDAVDYVQRLHEDDGYEFHCITSVPANEEVFSMRRQNLFECFGDSAIKRIVCVGIGETKKDILQEYRESDFFWLEDLPPNAEDGKKVGLKPILFNHAYNQEYETDIPRVTYWKEYYEYFMKPDLLDGTRG